jgi:hypothetical protein
MKERLMIDKDLNSKIQSLHQKFEDSGELMMELLRQDMEGGTTDEDEFLAAAQRRLTSMDALEALIKFATKEKRSVLNEFH